MGNEPSAELGLLLEALLEGRLSDAQQACFNDLLTNDPEARRAYVQHMATLAGVRRYLKGRPAFLDGVNEPPVDESIAAAEEKSGEHVVEPSGSAAALPPAPVAAPTLGETDESSLPPGSQSPTVLGFIAGCFRLGGDFVARPMVLILAAAACLLAVLLFAFAPATRNPQPAGDRPSNVFADGSDDAPAEPIFIARITDSHHAQWQDGASFPVGMSLLAVGQKLSLTSGLVEVSFDNGARVILEGPAEFLLDSPAHSTLTYGQLTAEVPEQAIGFTIQTPMVNVVDLGTKFGVRVSPKGMTDVAVFSGEVIASPHNAEADSEQSTRVLADEVRRFWNGSTIDEEPLSSPDFTLSIPKPVEIENPSFELPRIGGWMSREIAGWTIVSQPAWKGQSNGGVQLAAAERVQLPAPPDGQQWAFLETRMADDGGVHRTSMHQAVAKLAPNTEYRLRVTIGREGFVPVLGESRSYPFSSFAGLEIGLLSGPDPKLEPTEPLKTVRDPLPSLAARMAGIATLTYRSPAELPPGDQWLFIRLGVGANDWCRVLFDDVQLEAVPVGEARTAKNTH